MTSNPNKRRLSSKAKQRQSSGRGGNPSGAADQRHQTAPARQVPPSSQVARRDGGREVERDRPVQIRIGPGHPRFAAGTFDAASLLSELLSVLEPRIEAGLGSLREALSRQDGANDAARAARSAGKQIADSVRAGVVEGMRMRERHLAQLAVIDRAAAHASSLRELRDRIETELGLAGLQRVIEPGDLSAFNLARSNEGTAAGGPPAPGDAYEVLSPAYLDTETNRTIECGWLRPLEAGSEKAPPRGKEHGSSSRPHRQGKLLTDGKSAAKPPEQPKAGGDVSETRHPPEDDRQQAVERPTTGRQVARVGQGEADGSPSGKLPLRQSEGAGKEAPQVSADERVKHSADRSAPHAKASPGGRTRSGSGAVSPHVRAYAAKLRGTEQAGSIDHADDEGDQ